MDIKQKSTIRDTWKYADEMGGEGVGLALGLRGIPRCTDTFRLMFGGGGGDDLLLEKMNMQCVNVEIRMQMSTILYI